MNPKLRFLPLLFLYAFFIFLRSPSSLEGDESRYVRHAQNLSQGYFSPPDASELKSGPGYPLALLPVVLLKLPWPAGRMLNALFLFFAVLYFFSTLRLYLKERAASFFSYVFGLYPFFLKYIHLMYSETFAIFLVCGFIFHFCKTYTEVRKSWLQGLLAVLYLGSLTLTKVFFGYVILAGILFFVILTLWRKTEALKKSALIYLGALLLCVPYLAYTYSLTGKVFYWSIYGGTNLYWMTSPYEEELGDPRGGGGGVGHLQQSGIPELTEHHGPFFEEIAALSPVEWDARLKAKALNNIHHHPRKFIKNWICNVGRMLFNYPYSYTPQRMGTLFNIWTNMFIVVFSIVCIYPSTVVRKKMPFEIFALLFFGVVSFLGSSFLAAYERHFRVLVPIFALWIIVTLTRLVKIEFPR